MNTLKRIFPILFCAGSVLTTHAQTNVPGALDSLAGNFIKNLRRNPQEKILVHTDKWFYLSGESIWFKAYSLNALSDKITVQSKILFVDLVDAHDAVICKQVINIPEQKMTGKLFLPISLPEGYYWLRAYTRKILDEDTGRMFVQPIYVLNPRIPNEQALRLNENTSSTHGDDAPPQVSFFPEGGALISGTTSIVAFKAQDHFGKPVDVSGWVTDGSDTVSKFSSSFRGMGKIGLDIWKSRKYTAHIKWNNKDQTYNLPVINQYSSQLSVAGQSPNSFRVRVALGDSLYHKNKVNYLVGISKDSLCFAATGTDMYEIWIPKGDFPRGMATLVLFDDQKKVVSERNIYIDRDNHIVAIKSDKDKYGAREKASFDISVTDSFNRPLKAILSIDVTDDNMDKEFGLTTPTEENIFASMNLPVSGAKQYSNDEWDLIMLTQKEKFKGWNNENNFSSRSDRSYLAEPFLQNVSGTILDQKDNPAAGEVVTLFSTQQNIVFMSDTTDKAGRFEFRLPVAFPDSTSLNIQVANMNGLKQDKRILIDNFPFPHPLTPKGLRKKFDASKQVFLRDFIANQMDTTKFGKGKEWLREVTVMAAKKRQLFNEKRRLTMFSQIITSDQFEHGGINSLGFALLSSRGVYLKNGYVTVKGGFGFTSSAATEPLLVVDGVPILMDTMTNDFIGMGSKLMGYLSSIDASTVDFMEVITGPEASVYGLRGANGVISVNTSPLVRHDDAYALRGLRKFYTTGFPSQPSFSMPDYGSKDIKKSAFPDQRSTIYWNGNLITDENGKAAGSFYTADPSTTYTLTLMGVTADGSIVYKQAKLERK